MVEAILLQIPSPIREVLWVHAVNRHDGIMYAEHVLLYSLILLLLDLIQGPYHGIIVTLVTKCLLNVHWQVLHGDILAFIQCVSPFTRVPMETGKNVRAHACLVILLKEGIHIKPPECVCHFCPWISRLTDWHIQPHRCQPLLLPTSSASPCIYAGGQQSHSQWNTHWNPVPLCPGGKEVSLLHPPPCTGI